MDPVNPWLDPAEVRRLAERLMQPSQNPVADVADAGFSEGFEGYAGAATPRPSAIQTDQPARVIAPPSPETSLPEPPAPANALPSASPPPSARGPFLDRIHRFRDWLRHQFAATGIFILDHDGAVIFDESSHGRLHFLARSLARASRRQGAGSGNVHVKIGAGATLEVIPVDTPYGCLVLGAVVPEALPPSAVATVMQALSQVATPPEG